MDNVRARACVVLHRSVCAASPSPDPHPRRGQKAPPQRLRRSPQAQSPTAEEKKTSEGKISNSHTGVDRFDRSGMCDRYLSYPAGLFFERAHIEAHTRENEIAAES